MEETMKLEYLKVDEKTKAFFRQEMMAEHGEDWDGVIALYYAKYITMFFVKEQELDMEIAFLRGRLNTIIVDLRREYEMDPNLDKDKRQKENEHTIIYDIKKNLMKDFYEKISELEERRSKLRYECYKECYPQYRYEE